MAPPQLQFGKDHSRPRLSPNDRAQNSSNSYFLPGPRGDEQQHQHASSSGGAGSPFDFGFGAASVKATVDGSVAGGAGTPGGGGAGGARSATASAFAGARVGPSSLSLGRGASGGAGAAPGSGGFGFGGSTTPSGPVTSASASSPFFAFSLPQFSGNAPDAAAAQDASRTGAGTPGAGFNPFAPAHAPAQPPTPGFTLPASLAFAPKPPPIRTPIAGSRQTVANGRAILNPRYTTFSPASLLALLAASSPAGPTVLVLDLRTHSAWLQCRPRPSVNICVPSTLLRRPTHGVEQLAATLSGEDRTLFAAWNTTARTIVVLDQDSVALVEGSGLASLLAKFVAAKYEGTLGWVRGGFQAVKSEALGGGSDSARNLLDFGAAEGSSADASSAGTLATPGKHARPVLQVRDLPISAFQASSTSAFTHAGMPSASINMGGRSSAGSKASSSGRPGLGKRRKSGTESFGLTLDSLSAGSATPAIREVAEKRMATNPFFDNIRQNSEALSLERSLANLSPVELPELDAATLARLPPFLTSLIRLQPLERAHRLAKQFYDLEVAERERLEGALHWHANVQGTDSEHTDHNEFKKFGISAGVELGSLNRFKNIFPYDHARVRLKAFGSGATDYVNASHIQLKGSPRRYIASQGPLHSTFPDFWQMCDQEHVGVIIMLTNLHEGGREKCSRYWVPQPSCGWDVQVEGDAMDEEGGGGFFAPPSPSINGAGAETTVRRSIFIHRQSDPPARRRRIRHIQYRAWPDFDVPAKPSDVVELVREVEQAQRDYMAEIDWKGAEEPPILAHCSAGVGRTGVFIMVSTMLDKLARDRRAARDAAASDSMDIDTDTPTASPFPSPSSVGSSDTASISAGLSASTLEPSYASTSHAPPTAAELDGPPSSPSPPSVPPLESAEPVFAGVNELREQRMSMVANMRQFCSVHQIILEGALDEIRKELAAQ
ncbi:hypothetical protein RQP46_000615 [Phenoliferia psychrophenolica]